MLSGQKHLITCRCILPQLKRQSDPPTHRFVVFSTIDDEDNVIPSFVQCNNCRTVHRVVGLCQSEIMHGKEHMRSVRTADEIKLALPDKLVSLLESNHVDISTYEAVNFIIQNERWGERVVLAIDNEEGEYQGKYVRILSDTLFKVDTISSEMFVKEDKDD